LSARKALIVAGKFAPHAGGTAVVWTEWCRCWPAEEIQVVVPRIPHCQEFDRLQPYPIVRVAYPDIPKLRMPALWGLLGVRAGQLILKERPQVLHLQHVFENGPWGLVFKRLLGIPYWIHTYGEELTLVRRFPWLERLVRKVLAEAAGISTISHYTLELLQHFGVSPERCLLVHPGVEWQRFQARPPLRLELPPGRKLLTLGRLMQRKGQDTMIEVLPSLLEEFPDLHYLIAGIGPDENRLRALAQASSASERIHFLGRVDDDQLVPLMQACDVFAHPNRVTPQGDVEGFGIVFLEASACGIPVVGGRSGGTVDAVSDRHSGFLVEGAEELRQRLRWLLTHPEQARAMGEAGREWSRGFDWKGPAGRIWEASTR